MVEGVNALVIFTDVRGFSRWSEANEVFVNLRGFLDGFTTILRARFKPPAFEIRSRGDGALIYRRIDADLSRAEVTRLLARTLTAVRQVDADFARHCREFGRRVGHGAELSLGWGIVRGRVIAAGDDLAGHNVNKAARLCNEARPYGVIIDRDDFPDLPRDAQGFVEQERILRGMGEARVWVTGEIASQFVPRERLRETPEVHVAGTCISDDGGRIRLLVARRSPGRRLFPGLLEGCGGQLRRSETFADGVRRHFRLELGLDVDVLEDLHVFYTIREPGEPVIPGIRFLCRRVGTREPSSSNHSELRWVSAEEFMDIPGEDFVGDLKREVIELLRRYRDAAGTR
ncbi:NUDIX domain-containing protein [Actinomadura hallensis]|uniref:NUDIX domain-containing protein n=1 Tax=Actinomadura hallensis TaxID=337895 RepID=A0A543IB18_9ACTN|nr:NUDIX domain-containing protein [Actinomadura hallensis]TQM67783.1 NUDIX domain-containing protein [Actinomadura hallensis]